MRALLIAPVAFGALVAGYLWGFGVGEREGHDSDPEPVQDHSVDIPWQVPRPVPYDPGAYTNGG